MSLAWHISADARADLRGLETALQEGVFDELDALASDPSRLPAPVADWGIVHPFALVREGTLQVLTLHLSHNPPTQVLDAAGHPRLAGPVIRIVRRFAWASV